MKRKRRLDVQYTDGDYIAGYDMDLADWTALVGKLSRSCPLTPQENRRYGDYVTAITRSILEGPKLRNKPEEEREELRSLIHVAILTQVPSHFNPDKGSIYTYSYRVGYLECLNFFKTRARQVSRAVRHQDRVEEFVRGCHNESGDMTSLIFPETDAICAEI